MGSNTYSPTLADCSFECTWSYFPGNEDGRKRAIVAHCDTSCDTMRDDCNDGGLLWNAPWPRHYECKPVRMPRHQKLEKRGR